MGSTRGLLGLFFASLVAFSYWLPAVASQQGERNGELSLLPGNVFSRPLPHGNVPPLGSMSVALALGAVLLSYGFTRGTLRLRKSLFRNTTPGRKTIAETGVIPREKKCRRLPFPYRGAFTLQKSVARALADHRIDRKASDDKPRGRGLNGKVMGSRHITYGFD